MEPSPTRFRRFCGSVLAATAIALLWLLLAFGRGEAAPTASDSDPDRASPSRADSAKKPQREKGVIFQRLRFGADIEMRLDNVPNLVRIDLPELLSSRDHSISFAPVVGVGREAQFAKGRYHSDGSNSHVEAKWNIVEDAVHMSISVTNTGAEIAHGVNAVVCLQSGFAPTFASRRQKTWIFSDDRAMSFSELRELDGYRAAGSWVKGAATIENGGGQGEGYFDSYSARYSDHGVVFRRSKDRRWTLATLWEDAYRVFHNPAKPLACMHSDPAFGDIEPGATVTKRGWAVVHNGTPLQARDRLLNLMRRARSSAGESSSLP